MNVHEVAYFQWHTEITAASTVYQQLKKIQRYALKTFI
jgi:hypothetical protein